MKSISASSTKYNIFMHCQPVRTATDIEFSQICIKRKWQSLESCGCGEPRLSARPSDTTKQG